ncbi:hypothetical protein VCRA2120E331_30236 [Vibrio crassostreae]|nr:hypothetical protein VCRA2120E331_30236 [Vibrio crassostreae]CAK3504947.1 hypothetical protein VCRA2127O345_30236 [Vibrio crassostreae]CAK3541402.1 hypothetical protein VCRA2122O338_30236 [Vibrio crassostreae]CAK3606016.1 hypothetical protein VCRA2122O340_30236 [Vibrio crassostreae]CAK3927355.1 hypothetical protein VCRA2128O346_30236 [Vibrio crassostreae]
MPPAAVPISGSSKLLVFANVGVLNVAAMHKQAIERARLNILVSNTPFLLTVRQVRCKLVLYLI